MTQAKAAELIKELHDIERRIESIREDINDGSLQAASNDNIYNLATRVIQLMGVIHDIIDDVRK